MNNLADLPNKEGFTFVGIDYDHKQHRCTVKKNNIGCHEVHNEFGPFWSNLMGWMPLVKEVKK